MKNFMMIFRNEKEKEQEMSSPEEMQKAVEILSKKFDKHELKGNTNTLRKNIDSNDGSFTILTDRIIETINYNEVGYYGGLLNCTTWTIKN